MISVAPDNFPMREANARQWRSSEWGADSETLNVTVLGATVAATETLSPHTVYVQAVFCIQISQKKKGLVWMADTEQDA